MAFPEIISGAAAIAKASRLSIPRKPRWRKAGLSAEKISSSMTLLGKKDKAQYVVTASASPTLNAAGRSGGS
jgi:hypothetical protein